MKRLLDGLYSPLGSYIAHIIILIYFLASLFFPSLQLLPESFPRRVHMSYETDVRRLSVREPRLVSSTVQGQEDPVRQNRSFVWSALTVLFQFNVALHKGESTAASRRCLLLSGVVLLYFNSHIIETKAT